MSDRDGGPAFPTINTPHSRDDARGMSLRDYFAAHAPAMPESWGTCTIETGRTLIAKWAYAYADAMLAARSKP